MSSISTILKLIRDFERSGDHETAEEYKDLLWVIMCREAMTISKNNQFNFNKEIFRTLYEDCDGSGCISMVLTIWYATYGCEKKPTLGTPTSASSFHCRMCCDQRPECDDVVLSFKDFLRFSRLFNLIPMNKVQMLEFYNKQELDLNDPEPMEDDSDYIQAVRQCWKEDGITANTV